MRILVVVGTRPEAIKMAPVIKALRQHPDLVRVDVCATGQHRSLLDQVLNLFDVVPDFELNLMEEGQTPSQVAARVLKRLDPVLVELKPDRVLVQGDTTTVMAAAIAAHHRQVPVGHVEAGLRTYDRHNPFPEEMNRVVADHISDLLFAPTAQARSNLLREGLAANSIFVTGNTVIDALLWIKKQPLSEQSRELLVQHDLDEFLASKTKRLILVTAHRRENHGKPIRQICQALLDLARSRPHWHIIYPVHPNPNIWRPVHERLAGVASVTLLPPIDYAMLTHLMKKSYLIMTDSGGIQEEAPTLGIPVLVLRDVTERPEAVEAGAVRLVGTEPRTIVQAAQQLLDDQLAYEKMAKATNPYGDGHAARRIADVLLGGSCIEFSPQDTAGVSH